MKKLAFATAAVAVLALSVPAFTAPASAEDAAVKVKIGEGHRMHRDHGRHEGWRHREVKKVVIHRDRGRHEGWRHRHHEGRKTVIIKKREG